MTGDGACTMSEGKGVVVVVDEVGPGGPVGVTDVATVVAGGEVGPELCGDVDDATVD